jgi:hypothetical protein
LALQTFNNTITGAWGYGLHDLNLRECDRMFRFGLHKGNIIAISWLL